jgi:signal peptidase I
MMLNNLTANLYGIKEGAGFFIVKVTGNSMRPFIESGDCVLIRRCSLNELFSGNIVALFYNGIDSKNDILCVHRLIWKNISKTRMIFFMKGDSISFVGRIRIGKDAEFIGKVISVVKNNKMIFVDDYRSNFIGLFISLCLIPWQIIRRH